MKKTLTLIIIGASALMVTLSSCAPPMVPTKNVETIEKNNKDNSGDYYHGWGSHHPYYGY